MTSSIPAIGRELCFWCVETFRGCHIHETADVFWNDVSVRSFTSEDDGFRIVDDEKQLINVQSAVHYESGRFFLPPTGSTTRISSNSPSIFKFPRSDRIGGNSNFKQPTSILTSSSSKIGEKPKKTVQFAKLTKIRKIPKVSEERAKKRVGKIHENAVVTTARVYTRGKKCDQSQKLFVCNICEMSFTLRHNMQAHLVIFHGKEQNIHDDQLHAIREVYLRPKPQVD